MLRDPKPMIFCYGISVNAMFNVGQTMINAFYLQYNQKSNVGQVFKFARHTFPQLKTVYCTLYTLCTLFHCLYYKESTSFKAY